jgi:hypothetical protein
MCQHSQLKAFKCRRCGDAAARTDGVDLWFGVDKVPGDPLNVGWLCVKCRYPLKWTSERVRDLKRPKTTSNRISLTSGHKIA